MALSLGNKSFESILMQAPLAGVSCAPFRALTWRYSKPAVCYTEMISCKTLIHHAKNNKRFTHIAAQEADVGFQLCSNDPEELGQAVRMVTDLGAGLIDLNCGCPVKKIRRKGSGSKLLSDASHLYKLISAMRNNTSLPISIKIRVDGQSGDKNNIELIKVIQDSGVDFVIVHGRHWTEHYETTCRYEEIRYFVDNLKIPVIGNGDVACPASLDKLLATGCQGAMIGRAGVGQPWLIGLLEAHLQNKHFEMPGLNLRGQMFLEHVNGLAELLLSEKFALIQARNFAKYYARNCEFRAEFAQAVNTCQSLSHLTQLCFNYFK